MGFCISITIFKYSKKTPFRKLPRKSIGEKREYIVSNHVRADKRRQWITQNNYSVISVVLKPLIFSDGIDWID